MSHILDLIPRKVCDFDDKFGLVSIPAGTTTDILNFRTKTGKHAFLVGLSTAAESAGIQYLTYDVKQDTSKIWPYGSINVQLSDPAIWSFLPFPISLNQNALIQVSATNAGPAAYNATARLMIYYAEIDK